MLPALHGRIWTFVPAAGEPEPASMHRSVLLSVLNTWIRPPAMFWLLVSNVYVPCRVRADTELMSPLAWSVPRDRSSANAGVRNAPPPLMQRIRFADSHGSDRPCGSV